jgi:hypothetical protein
VWLVVLIRIMKAAPSVERLERPDSRSKDQEGPPGLTGGPFWRGDGAGWLVIGHLCASANLVKLACSVPPGRQIG